MVQIIPIRIIDYRIPFIELYIPHGSDNTFKNYCHLISLLLLYIPHGSDNTNSIPVILLVWSKLYIPHGSDNTIFSAMRSNNSRFFISHMVQIIPFCH